MTTIPMLEKELKQANKDLYYYKNYSERLKNKLQQKENIIKEVREYIEEWQRFPHTNGSTHKELKNLIDILEKENNGE